MQRKETENCWELLIATSHTKAATQEFVRMAQIAKNAFGTALFSFRTHLQSKHLKENRVTNWPPESKPRIYLWVWALSLVTATTLRFARHICARGRNELARDKLAIHNRCAANVFPLNKRHTRCTAAITKGKAGVIK